MIIGINKPGGAGRIKLINEDGTYCVSYILGGKEDHIDIKYIKRREDIDGRPQRKRIATNNTNNENNNESKVTEIKESLQKKIKKNSQNESNKFKDKKEIKKKQKELKDLKEVVDENCPYLGLDDVSSIIESEEGEIEEVEEVEEEKQEEEGKSSLSPTLSLTQQSNELTNISLTIFEALFDAIHHCKETLDGGYLFNDIQKFLLEHISNSTTNDVEDAIKYAETMNKFMIIMDNDTNKRLLYPID